MLFSAFDQSLNICSVRSCAVAECQREVQPCSTKCSVRLTIQQLNITKQHSTLLNKCSELFSQNVQYVFVQGLTLESFRKSVGVSHWNIFGIFMETYRQFFAINFRVFLENVWNLVGIFGYIGSMRTAKLYGNYIRQFLGI